MLKKKENSLYRVRGKKLQGVYFAFDTTFAGYLIRCVWPTRTSRGGFVSVCSESSLAARLEPKRKLAALIPGILIHDPLCDTRSKSANERAELRRRSFSSGASSSVKLRELACDLRSPSSSRSSRRPAVSSDGPCAPEAFRRHTRFPMPTRKFLQIEVVIGTRVARDTGTTMWVEVVGRGRHSKDSRKEVKEVVSCTRSDLGAPVSTRKVSCHAER